MPVVTRVEGLAFYVLLNARFDGRPDENASIYLLTAVTPPPSGTLALPDSLAFIFSFYSVEVLRSTSYYYQNSSG